MTSSRLVPVFLLAGFRVARVGRRGEEDRKGSSELQRKSRIWISDPPLGGWVLQISTSLSQL